MKYVFASLIFLLYIGCTGGGNGAPGKAPDGNGEAYSGYKPKEGFYYFADTRVRCSNSNNQVTGFRGFIEITKAGVIFFHPPCSNERIAVALSDLRFYGGATTWQTNSGQSLGFTAKRSPTAKNKNNKKAVDIGIPPESLPDPIISYQRGIYGRMETQPTAGSTDRLTPRALIDCTDKGIAYQVVIQATGTTLNPTQAKALVVVSKVAQGLLITGSRVIEIPLYAPDANQYTGADFDLKLSGSGTQLGATLTAVINGSAMSCSTSQVSNTALNAPAPEITVNPVLLSAGYKFSCGVANGGVSCWGMNDRGQLGIGSITSDKLLPVPVIGLTSNVTKVSTGVGHACAIQSGSVFCWGMNTDGQLGRGGPTTAFEATPAIVPGFSPVTEISAGGSHTCAIKSSKAFCWGHGANGQLGDGTGGVNSTSPIAVVGISDDVISIATGNSHSCAVTVKGDSFCWGLNDNGQLGMAGGAVSSAQKIDNLRLINISAPSIASTSCGITDTATVKCWGDNSNSNVTADGLAGGNVFTPSQIPSLPDGVTAVATGQSHVCAIRAGKPYCWGTAANGELGRLAGVGLEPIGLVSGLTEDIFSITAGGSHTLARGLTTSKGWGSGSTGQLGNGGNSNNLTPITVQFP